jgi:glucan phosphoethanolaminetransferase (alkaline phosphatase superfamily)
VAAIEADTDNDESDDNMQRLNRLIKSEVAALLLLSLALVAQMPHAAMVFHRLADLPPDVSIVENYSAWIHAATYALALELATLFFVVRGKIRIAYVFAVASVLINLAYYQTWQRGMWDIAQIALVSLILPVAIAMYSHDAAESIARSEDAPQPARKIKPQPDAPSAQPATKRKSRKRKATASDKQTQAAAMSADGATNASIARTLNVVPSTVGRWLKNTNGAIKETA